MHSREIHQHELKKPVRESTVRVLAVLHYPIFGGPHNQFVQLNTKLQEVGIDLTVAITDEDGNALERFRNSDVKVVPLPLGRLRANVNPSWAIRYARDVRSEIVGLQELMRSLNIDVVIVSGLVNPHGAVAASRCGIPVVWQIIDSRTPSVLTPAFMSLARRYASCFMFWGKELILNHVGQRSLRQPLHVFGPPVNVGRFTNSRKQGMDLRRSIGIGSHDPVIGTLANVNPQKGIEHFGKAAVRIFEQHPDSWFLVVGAIYPHFESYAACVRSDMEEGGIPGDRIVFAGEVQDISSWLGMFDVKLVTSVPRSEGIPTAAVEAMTAGVPVVTTDVGSVRDAVIDGETGRVVSPGDARAIAEAACEILADEEKAVAMSTAARELAAEKFSIEACVAVHRAAIQDALQYGAARKRRIGSGA